MTNNDAINYAVIALNRLVRQGIVNTEEKDIYTILSSVMGDLMDANTESEAKNKAYKIMEERK